MSGREVITGTASSLYLPQSKNPIMFKSFWGLLLAITLVGCSTTPEVQRCIDSTPRASSDRWACLNNANVEAKAREQQNQYFAAQRQIEQMRTAAESQCRGYGFAPGTTPFAQCVMQIDMAKRAAFDQQRQAEQLRSQRHSQCRLVQSQAWLSSGPSFFEALPQVSAAFDNCMAGIPPPPKLEVFCSRIGRDEVRCSSR
jgi:hypothetical protein